MPNERIVPVVFNSYNVFIIRKCTSEMFAQIQRGVVWGVKMLSKMSRTAKLYAKKTEGKEYIKCFKEPLVLS